MCSLCWLQFNKVHEQCEGNRKSREKISFHNTTQHIFLNPLAKRNIISIISNFTFRQSKSYISTGMPLIVGCSSESEKSSGVDRHTIGKTFQRK